MPKYYISSGDLRCEIDRPTKKMAIIDAFSNLEGVQALGIITQVSEVGYEISEESSFLITTKILEAIDDDENWKEGDPEALDPDAIS